MATTVCLGATSLRYPIGGGHQWVFLNWALGFRSIGCEVIWLEQFDGAESPDAVQARLDTLRKCLAPYGLADRLAVCTTDGHEAPDGLRGCLSLEEAAAADLFLNTSYRTEQGIVGRFRRSALLDIDPGLLQRWLSRGEIRAAEHDLYFTIGETVGQPGARFPDAGLPWLYTPPCVALDWWPPHPPADDAPFTTVTHWYGHEWVEDDNGEVYENNKRRGFAPYFDLPRLVNVPMEVAISFGPGDEGEKQNLASRGWRVRHAWEVAATPSAYHRYIQHARGEFSGVKASCVRLQNAWISDRTLCFLASGKPAVVQHTGPSRFLPDAAGLHRFRDLADAADRLRYVTAHYAAESSLARALAEEYFDARRVTCQVLERAVP